jgi:hypothetical protein
MGYKILGFAVWHGAKWYLARKLPDRRLLAAGAVGLGVAVAGAVAAGQRRRAA